MERRVDLGYDTQQAAALDAKVGTTTWGLLENGRIPKTRRVQQNVAKILQLTMEEVEALKRGPPSSPSKGAPKGAPSREGDISVVIDLVKESADKLEEVLRELHELRDLVEQNRR